MKNTKWSHLSIAALAITFACLPAASCSGQSNNAADFEYKTNPKKADQEMIITGYTGASKTISIPARIGGKNVSVIGDGAFSGKGLTSVTIPNGVTEISNGAFSRNQLTSISIPRSVTSLSGFSGNQLTSVTIPNSVTTIDHSAFINNRLTSITIPNSVAEIGQEAFAGNQLTSVTIPRSVARMYANVFANNQLTSVVIENGVTSLGTGGAFANNQLTSVTIPASITLINSDTFENNPLTTVTIGANVQVSARATQRGEISEIPAFPNGFGEFYNSTGQKAGTYTYSNGQWAYRQ